MPYVAKTSRREHLSETCSVIWALFSLGYSASKIQLEVDVPKSTITSILRRLRKTQDHKWRQAVRTGRPPKLDARAERRLVRYISLHPFDPLQTFCTPSKSGFRLYPNTIRSVLKDNEVYAFRPRRKPYLSKTHKKIRYQRCVLWRFLKEEDMACIAFQTRRPLRLGLILR